MSDLEAFEQMVREHQDAVFSTALRLCGDAATAEDLAQEAFLKAWKHFAALRDAPARGAWLKTVARNLALNHLTREQRRWQFFSQASRAGEEELAPADAADALLRRGDPSQSLPGQPPAPAGAPERNERTAAVERALRQLPAKQRVPLVLYHFEELSYEEIARSLKVSLAKVRTDIARGREALKALLTPYLRDGAAV